MTEFEQSLERIQNELYGTLLIPQELVEEGQNKDYSGGRFRLKQSTVRYRQAKLTPKKRGQFVAFWHKKVGKNRPYSVEESLDFLVVTTVTETYAGQFIFPKGELAKRGILSHGQKMGKMAMRVYPSWDQPQSAQGILTQDWQLPFFIEFGGKVSIDARHLKKLYMLD